MAYYAVKPSQIPPILDLLQKGGKPLIVGIVGAPLSGKTWLAKSLSSIYGGRSLQIDGRPSTISLDEFLSSKARHIYEKTGLGLYHPRSYDVESLRNFVEKLLESGMARVGVKELVDGELKEVSRTYVLPSSGILIIEGLYTCSLLGDLIDACIYVEVPYRLELIMRRVVKVAYGMGTEEALRNASLSNISWELYGKNQKKLADIVFFNRYRVLEDVGRPSYQFKVCFDDLKEKYPHLADRLTKREPVDVEDYVVTEGTDRLRVRVFYENDIPSSLEVSYRYPVVEGVPYLRVVKYGVDIRLLPAFLTAVRVSGLGVKSVKREITFDEDGGVTFKYYPDRGVVELESSDLSGLESYLRTFRGLIRLKSYYTGEKVCG